MFYKIIGSRDPEIDLIFTISFRSFYTQFLKKRDMQINKNESGETIYQPIRN